ncbi:MAG: TonB-dependent receptor [Bacteroidia bacterium]
MKIPLGYVIVLVFLGLKGFAQQTHTLAAVEIHAHVKVLDTLDLTTSNANNLTQMLMLQPGLLLRNYGPGASAAIAVRGGSTGQTQVYWHDFSVQHPMLGITDASALPVFLFDRV